MGPPLVLTSELSYARMTGSPLHNGREARRIDARLDEEFARQVDHLQKLKQISTSAMVREAIADYYRTVVDEEAQRPLSALETSGFVGCAEGSEDLSSSNKTSLGESLEPKHGDR